MCFVFFNDRADRARETADCVTRYWDWRPRANPEEYWQYFDGTAPTHHLYGLRVALDMIKAEGIENVWRRHEVLAQAIWAAFDVWSAKGPVRLNVGDPALRSWAVTAAHAGSPDAERLREWCERVAGLTLGIGLGRSPADAWFRIGHMGHVSAPMILGALGTIEAGLAALQIPHGAGGVAAAAEVVARA
jgi:alanine-glyoxylate transaminase/serine-glyoxylate transaminase/serine-pyruvate transaminase